MEGEAIRVKALAGLGAALFGARWQAELARTIGVSDRTIRRWVDGSNHVPDWCLRELKALAVSRRVLLADLLSDLRNI